MRLARRGRWSEVLRDLSSTVRVNSQLDVGGRRSRRCRAGLRGSIGASRHMAQEIRIRGRRRGTEFPKQRPVGDVVGARPFAVCYVRVERDRIVIRFPCVGAASPLILAALAHLRQVRSSRRLDARKSGCWCL